MKKWLLLGALALGLPACELFGPRCGGEVLPYFDVQGVSLVAQSQTYVLSPGDQVAFRDLTLWLRLQRRYYAAARPGLLPAAYACDPAPNGYKGTTEALDSIVVTSRYDYDARHPAGTSLNDLVYIDGGLDGNGPQLLAQAQSSLAGMSINDRTLTLAQGPARTSGQQFVVRYRLRNGEVYTAETSMINVMP